MTTKHVRPVITICAGLALALALFMWHHERAFHVVVPGCTGANDCGSVANSRWALWGPLPVASLGVACYCFLIVAAWMVEYKHCTHCKMIWSLMVIQSLVGIGFVVWLLAVQWVAIGHFCKYCLTSHVFGGFAFLMILRKAPVWKQVEHAVVKFSSSSIAVLSVLIAVHVWVEPNLMVVQAAEDIQQLDADGLSPFSGGSIQIGKKTDSRNVSLLNNNLTFDLYKVPLEGDPNAQYVILDLSDYCCPECRKVHGRLKAFKEKYKVDLAVVMLPVPMSPECNPDLKKLHPGFKHSCTYIRYAMAVAAVAPDKFASYHDFLMDGGRPPSVEEARSRGEELLGKEAFAEALSNPAVDQWINDGLNIYRFIEGTSIPKLIVNDSILSAGSGSKFAFFEKLHGLLELPDPQ